MTASWFRISADVLAACLRISANASAAGGSVRVVRRVERDARV
jgi:hypothetical protein